MTTQLLDNLWIPREEDKGGSPWNGMPYLTDLAKVNIFIGPNNSGKSRVLRRLFGSPIQAFPEDSRFEEAQEIANHRGRLNDLATDLQVYHQDISGFLPDSDVPEATLPPIPTPGSVQSHPSWANDATRKLNESPEIEDAGRQALCVSRQTKYLGKLLGGLRQCNTTDDRQRIYIPTLRGLRPLPEDTERHLRDPYINRTTGDYFANADAVEHSIFTGLALYEEFTHYILGTREDRQLVREYEDFLSEEFFEGEDVSLTPDRKSDVVRIDIGGEERHVYDFGDGIQQMIIMTFPVFMKKDEPTILFIEEPELFLHPGMQRRLLEIFTISEAFKNCQVIMTTHSNHFLDMTLETDNISVYRFRKTDKDGEGKPTFEIKNTSRADFNLLRDLGVRNSSVFHTNCTIWVEGISDRIYVRKYLQIYQDEMLGENDQRFKEDTHYSIAEYAGSNLKHWLFSDEVEEDDQDGKDARGIVAKHLCGRALIIADRDSGKEAQHKERAEELEARYYVLKSREIENTLSPGALEKAIRSYRNFAGLKFKNPIGSQEKYRSKCLGRYIADTILPEGQGKSFKGKSGTIGQPKEQFALKACSQIHSPDDMSEDAEDLAKRIYGFIAEHNPAPTAAK